MFRHGRGMSFSPDQSDTVAKLIDIPGQPGAAEETRFDWSFSNPPTKEKGKSNNMRQEGNKDCYLISIDEVDMYMYAILGGHF